jgi:caffeoyl-CoA O-methyltransferase
MFHHIPHKMLERMHYMERIDEMDRVDGTPTTRRLRQIPPETGRLIALLATGAPAGEWVEIGTSGGYSTLWLTLAAREKGRRITTMDIDEAKIRIARETFRLAGVEHLVNVVHGDALELLRELDQIAFCFLDTEKELYLACYELVVPRLVKGGLLVADNAVSHQADLQALLDRAETDERVDALVVPLKMGELICRKI